ncbi:hypothetical protein [Methylobacterium sp. Leaf85]|uniref:hypothetical protein n=1 Tax=Methylobacterium sp. Leaf85 TaxID=1736241 RepID=UPI0006F71702|nr:hypothetical protein [Methylobacterium sp. Leaf85]KQO42494.1 hypothetical protein ASF08_12895 [Methylobacterium sp. Leaf85]
MPVIEIRRTPCSLAARAAIIGTIRALEMAFPVMMEEAILDRLGKAMAALVKVEVGAELEGAVVVV